MNESFWDKLRTWIVVNYKTTLTGLVGSISIFAAQYGVTFSEAAQQRIIGWITAAVVLLLGIFSRDAKTQAQKEGERK